jgi:Fe2+ or Zn2+ uptake regulation protein
VSTQAKELARVRSRIEQAVIDFVSRHRWFDAKKLHAAVADAAPNTAPGSADRIMRDLRSRGLISVTCVNRSASLYRSDSIKP